NSSSVVLRNNLGETEVKTSDIKSRRSTGRSLMPEGFEALGDEALRDLFAFMGAGENRFRIIDLKPAFTANSTLGLFNNRDLTDESIRFRKYGLMKAGDIPFGTVTTAMTTSGNDLVVLMCVSSCAWTYRQSAAVGRV